MRGKVVGLIVLVSGCSSLEPVTGSTEQEVADPAPSLSITSVKFSNVVSGTSVNYCGFAPHAACSATPEAQVRWGTPAFGTAQSGLGFDRAITSPITLTYGANFALGSLTHFNFPTYSGTWASGANLDLHLLIEPSLVGPAIFDSDVSIPLTIFETPNEEPCPTTSAVPCDDTVTFVTSSFQLASTTSTTVYDLNIIGFVAPMTTTIVPGLVSEEYKTSSATLIAQLREHCIDLDDDVVCDEVDLCLGTPNPGNADGDGDGQGDACDACPEHAENDPDGDGVCGLPEPCPCDADWKNHGQYVSCVAHATKEQVRNGELTDQQRADLVSAAGQSDCGK